MSSLPTQVPVDPSVQTAMKNQHVYLLFAREVGPLVKAKYPTIQKVQFNQILGRIWNEMPISERDKYHQKAEFQLNLQKLADFQTNIKQEKNTNEQVYSEPSPSPVQQQPATNVYSMDNPNNENVKRIFIQTVDNDASPQQPIDDEIVQGPKQKTNPDPQDMMKQYPMFPMYFKNMYTTLKKIFSDKSDLELKLKAFAMFQEMLLTDSEFSNITTTTGHKTIPEPAAQLFTETARNMPDILSTEVPVIISVTPPPQIQPSPTYKTSHPSPNPFTSDSFKHIEMKKSSDEEKTKEEETVLEKDHGPVEKDSLEGPDPFEQTVASEPELTLEETSVRISNENISDEYQITIKQEPITGNEEPITESANAELGDETSLDLSAVSPHPSSEELILEAPFDIKTERIEIASVESIATQEDDSAVMSSSENTEQKDPKTQVVFHNLDFFIKTEQNEVQSEENENGIFNPQVDKTEPSTMKGPSMGNENLLPVQPMETPESETTLDASKKEDNCESISEAFSHADNPASNKKVEKADTKDELKSLIDALVSKRTPDREIIRKIVIKTRSNLKETEAPIANYRKTHRMDMENSFESNNPAQVLYCYCRSPSSKNLIGCDFCPEWFHPKCLGLSKYELKMVLSLSNWKCPECIKNTDRDKKVVKEMQRSAKNKTRSVSPKNKSSPVIHTTPQIKVRRVSTDENIDNSPVEHAKKSVEKVDTPEVIANMVKQDSKPKCDTCRILVVEVKRRGDIIERMAKKIQMLENNHSVDN